jgi:hypothetical protein
MYTRREEVQKAGLRVESGRHESARDDVEDERCERDREGDGEGAFELRVSEGVLDVVVLWRHGVPPRGLVLNHSDFELFTPVLNNDLFVVLLDDASASPASNDFDLVAQSSA